MNENETLDWLTELATNILGLRRDLRSLHQQYADAIGNNPADADRVRINTEYACKVAAIGAQLGILEEEAEKHGGIASLMQ